MTGSSHPVLHAQAQGVAMLRLNQPERGNALSAALVDALQHAVDTAIADPDVHTLVLRGTGRHFCTGLDLTHLATESDGDVLLRLVRIEALLGTLWSAPIRTVALVQGRAWGAGADLVAACETRVADAASTFRFPGALFGIALGSRRLAQRIGRDVAREVLTQGRELDAAQAASAGLLTEVVPTPDDLDAVLAGLSAPRVDRATAARLRAATAGPAQASADADLAALVRSAAVPGLKTRIEAYRAASVLQRA